MMSVSLFSLEKKKQLSPNVYEIEIEWASCDGSNEKHDLQTVASEKLQDSEARPLCFYELQHAGQLHLPWLGGSTS